jgi:integrase
VDVIAVLPEAAVFIHAWVRYPEAGQLMDGHDLVFATRRGGPIERTEDWRSWKAILRQAQVRDVRVHDARHTTPASGWTRRCGATNEANCNPNCNLRACDESGPLPGCPGEGAVTCGGSGI